MTHMSKVQFSHFSVKELLTSSRLATASGEVSNYYIYLDPARLGSDRAEFWDAKRGRDEGKTEHVGNEAVPVGG